MEKDMKEKVLQVLLDALGKNEELIRSWIERIAVRDEAENAREVLAELMKNNQRLTEEISRLIDFEQS